MVPSFFLNRPHIINSCLLNQKQFLYFLTLKQAGDHSPAPTPRPPLPWTWPIPHPGISPGQQEAVHLSVCPQWPEGGGRMGLWVIAVLTGVFPRVFMIIENPTQGSSPLEGGVSLPFHQLGMPKESYRTRGWEKGRHTLHLCMGVS